MAARLARRKAEQLGHRAETIALWYLRFKGYRLLARRFKSPAGEVDLVMRRGQTTAFIEVKARPTVNEAIEAVTPYQSKRIAAAAGFFMSRDDMAAKGFCRFDIVAIPSTLWPTHIINAFDGTR
jgi:putative endonuclease